MSDGVLVEWLYRVRVQVVKANRGGPFWTIAEFIQKTTTWRPCSASLLMWHGYATRLSARIHEDDTAVVVVGGPTPMKVAECVADFFRAHLEQLLSAAQGHAVTGPRS
jgi:hypothetical protein